MLTIEKCSLYCGSVMYAALKKASGGEKYVTAIVTLAMPDGTARAYFIQTARIRASLGGGSNTAAVKAHYLLDTERSDMLVVAVVPFPHGTSEAAAATTLGVAGAQFDALLTTAAEEVAAAKLAKQGEWITKLLSGDLDKPTTFDNYDDDEAGDENSDEFDGDAAEA